MQMNNPTYIDTSDSSAFRGQVNFKQSLINQMERIGIVTSTNNSNDPGILSIRFSMAVNILEAQMSPYLDKEYYKEMKSETIQKLERSDRPNDIIQYSLIKYHNLVSLMDRKNLLLPHDDIDYIIVAQEREAERLNGLHDKSQNEIQAEALD